MPPTRPRCWSIEERGEALKEAKACDHDNATRHHGVLEMACGKPVEAIDIQIRRADNRHSDCGSIFYAWPIQPDFRTRILKSSTMRPPGSSAPWLNA